jgi:uncharacterized protein DUF4326
MNKLKVINICDTDYLKTRQLPPNSVYVGRAVPRRYKLKESKWCNPPENRIPRNAPLAKRLEAIEKFRVYLMSKPELLAQIGELRGKDLVQCNR